MERGESLLVSKQASAHQAQQNRQNWSWVSSYLATGSSGFTGAQFPSLQAADQLLSSCVIFIDKSTKPIGNCQ